jgi:hypothetical protein
MGISITAQTICSLLRRSAQLTTISAATIDRRLREAHSTSAVGATERQPHCVVACRFAHLLTGLILCPAT